MAPRSRDNYVLFAKAKGTSGSAANPEYPAVTITLAKRKGANATLIAENVLRKIDSLRGNMLPDDLNVTVTRNYGETAKDKSNELLEHLLIATLSVTLLIGLALGWRESGVVLLAIPVTLALTLAIFYHLRLHAEPSHAFRADFFHWHFGGRRDRRGRKHRSPFPPTR